MPPVSSPVEVQIPKLGASDAIIFSSLLLLHHADLPTAVASPAQHPSFLRLSGMIRFQLNFPRRANRQGEVGRLENQAHDGWSQNICCIRTRGHGKVFLQPTGVCSRVPRNVMASRVSEMPSSCPNFQVKVRHITSAGGRRYEFKGKGKRSATSG